MTVLDHLAVVAMEECNEVAQRISKALRFGFDEIQPGQEKTNAERITDELADLMATIEMIEDEGVKFGDFNSAILVAAKKNKVRRFLKFSAQCKRLDP